MTSSAEAIEWLRLRHVEGISSGVLTRIQDRFASAEAAFTASLEELNQIKGIPPWLAEAIRERRVGKGFQADCDWAAHSDCTLLIRGFPGYPSLLAEISAPPPLLYVQGNAKALDQGPTLALVGSRSPTRTGAETAYAFAKDLASAGFILISGLARGIDHAVHRGVLAADGVGVGVLGCGPDRIYPRESLSLAEGLRERGAVVSEFPIGTPPRPPHFPQRNRIISGLSVGVVVVEGSDRSGALITARWAGMQGREVFAIPGSIHSPLSRAPHRLLKEGAKLVETLTDIVEELDPSTEVSLACTTEQTQSTRPERGAGTDKEGVLECIDYYPTPLERIVERSGLAIERVSTVLTELEIEGRVASSPGGQFTRIP